MNYADYADTCRRNIASAEQSIAELTEELEHCQHDLAKAQQELAQILQEMEAAA